MDTTEDSPSTTNPVSMNLLSPSPLGNTPFSPNPPVQSPIREDDTSHLFTENGPGRTSEVPSQTSPPLHDDPGCDSPTARLPTESPLPSHPSTPTPGTLLSPPLLGIAGSDAFDLTGVNGDFISEDTCVYWESVPGGEEWVALVRSYLKLEAITPIKSVSRVMRHTICNKLTIVSSNISNSGGHLDHKSYERG